METAEPVIRERRSAPHAH